MKPFQERSVRHGNDEWAPTPAAGGREQADEKSHDEDKQDQGFNQAEAIFSLKVDFGPGDRPPAKVQVRIARVNSRDRRIPRARP